MFGHGHGVCIQKKLHTLLPPYPTLHTIRYDGGLKWHCWFFSALRNRGAWKSDLVNRNIGKVKVVDEFACRFLENRRGWAYMYCWGRWTFVVCPDVNSDFRIVVNILSKKCRCEGYPSNDLIQTEGRVGYVVPRCGKAESSSKLSLADAWVEGAGGCCGCCCCCWCCLLEAVGSEVREPHQGASGGRNHGRVQREKQWRRESRIFVVYWHIK